MAVPAPPVSGSAAAAPRIPPGHLNPAALYQLQPRVCSALMSPSCCITASEVPPPGTALGWGRGRVGQDDCEVKSREGGARAERAGRQASATRTAQDRSMPPGLGVLRGPAAPTQPEPRRERPQPAQPQGSSWGFSWMPTACASEEARSLSRSRLRWNKPSSGRSDKTLGGKFLF